MPNPMTSAVIAAIAAETPTLAGTPADIGNRLKQAFDEQAAFTTVITAQELFLWNPATSSGLTFGFRGGRLHYMKGGAPVEIAAGTVVLSDNTTNYVEYDPVTETVVKNTSGFTDGRLPLYTVITASGAFDAEDVTDKRTPYVLMHGKVVTADNLDDGIGHLLNQATFTIADEVANARDITVTVKTLETTPGAIASRRVLEIWIADSTSGWETGTVPNGGISVEDGVEMDVLTVDKRLRLMTEADGTARVRITHTSTGTWYMRVRIGSKVFTSSAITFA